MITNIRLDLNDEERLTLGRILHPTKKKHLATRKEVSETVAGLMAGMVEEVHAAACEKLPQNGSYMPKHINGSEISVKPYHRMSRDEVIARVRHEHPEFGKHTDGFVYGYGTVKYRKELRPDVH